MSFYPCWVNVHLLLIQAYYMFTFKVYFRICSRFNLSVKRELPVGYYLSPVVSKYFAKKGQEETTDSHKKNYMYTYCFEDIFSNNVSHI